MATPKARNGFQLAGHLNGHTAPHTQRFQKSTAGQGDAGRLFVGDPVILASAGTVMRMVNTSGLAAVDTEVFVGVVTGIFETVEGRPLTHRALKYATTADAFWVDVITDPDAIWEVATGATVTQTDIGTITFVSSDFTAENSAAGISGAGVGAAAATSTTTGFRIIDLIEDEGRTAKTSAAEGKVRLVSVGHAFSHGNTTAI